LYSSYGTYSSSYHFSKIQLTTANLIHIWFFSPLKLYKGCGLDSRIYGKWNAFGYFTISGSSSISIGGKASASNVWVGTQKYLRNAVGSGLKEWGLDSPPVYAWYYYKLKIGIQLFVSKPIYAGLVLQTVPFTELINPKLWNSSVQTSPPPPSSSALLYIS